MRVTLGLRRPCPFFFLSLFLRWIPPFLLSIDSFEERRGISSIFQLNRCSCTQVHSFMHYGCESSENYELDARVSLLYNSSIYIVESVQLPTWLRKRNDQSGGIASSATRNHWIVCCCGEGGHQLYTSRFSISCLSSYYYYFLSKWWLSHHLVSSRVDCVSSICVRGGWPFCLILAEETGIVWRIELANFVDSYCLRMNRWFSGGN